MLLIYSLGTVWTSALLSQRTETGWTGLLSLTAHRQQCWHHFSTFITLIISGKSQTCFKSCEGPKSSNLSIIQ